MKMRKMPILPIPIKKAIIISTIHPMIHDGDLIHQE